jgi:hypothetical protein
MRSDVVTFFADMLISACELALRSQVSSSADTTFRRWGN